MAEFEWDSDKFGFSNRQSNRSSNETSANIQVNASVTPWSFAKGEFVLDYDTDTDRLEVDEAVLSLERNAWELTYGHQYLPFGVYFSHFASGPLLEFGETRDIATTLTYDFQDRAELSVAAYQGQGQGINGKGSRLDWALGMETWLGESVSFGVSYQSDLADAASDLLSDTRHRYTRRVSGLSGYMLWTSDHFEVTAEFLGALRSFRELQADRNQPLAWNLEVTNFLNPNFDWALRLEGSDELEDAPELRYGASVSFRAGRYGSLTLDYLHSRFKHNFANDDAGNTLSHDDQFALQLSIAF
ncbi:LbtU family siderophore porin [Thiogranum longum]|uniref:LbtU family siderophore porin n=1 Tax=Thiogranum longum TaxID=1537524 RepID=UPI002436B49D|nr:LbtU family siderophore porin [Thiogranum longum]